MLDASIYQNQAQQKSFADVMMPWANLAQAKQNIEQSQAATANLQAQNAGLVAESALKQKQAAGQAWLTENSPKFKREDGSFDMSGLINDAKAAGHIQLAQDIALNDAKQLSDYATAKINEAKATYAPQTAKADADKASADALTATTQAVARTWGHMSTFLKGLPPDQQAQAYMAQRDVLMRTNPTVFNNATLPEYNGKNMKDIQSALEKGSMTPEVTKNLELGFGTLGVAQQNAGTSAEAVRQSGIQNQTGPDARTGLLDDNARKILEDQGYHVRPGATRAEIYNDPAARAILGSSIQTGPERSAAINNREDALAQSRRYQTAFEIGRGILKDQALKNAGKAGGFVSNWLDVVKADPARAAFMTSVQEYNATHPGDQITNNTAPQEAVAKLGRAQAEAESNAKKFEKGTGATIKPQGSAAPPVMMINPKTGRKGPVPFDQVDNLLARGYKRL